MDIEEMKEVAREAGLHYVTDLAPGISRRGNSPKRFQYFYPDGRPVRDRATLKRIRMLAIPPAYQDVWIAIDARAHLQATGRDQRGRKQYRYHAQWREFRDENKFNRLIEFSEVLPMIRRQTRRDLEQPGLTRTKVLASVVHLLETTLIRVGNEEYARENKSFGLSTLRGRHAKVRGEKVQFEFRGKSGVPHKVQVIDRRLAAVVRHCQDLPGQELFQYVGEDGEPHPISSTDVNSYLQEMTGERFTAKDFRTWAGTVQAAMLLSRIGAAERATELKRNIVQAIKQVAEQLRNTPSVCRKCYVHPEVLAAYQDGETVVSIQHARKVRGLTADEGKVGELLRKRARRAA